MHMFWSAIVDREIIQWLKVVKKLKLFTISCIQLHFIHIVFSDITNPCIDEFKLHVLRCNIFKLYCSFFHSTQDVIWHLCLGVDLVSKSVIHSRK
jgi:hypothetical protein